MTNHIRTLGLASCLLLTIVGCERSKATPLPSQSATQAVTEKTPTQTVKRIVFVGKEHACDCTRKAVDDGLAILQNALGTPAKLPMERLQIDTDAAKVKPFQQQKAIMALPAIYFLDANNVVLEMLQGEVKAEEIESAIGKRNRG